MSEAYKKIVEESYDQIAVWYDDWVQTQDSPRQRYTTKVLENAKLFKDAPPYLHILELGCGAGVPITRMLLDAGTRVTANDISTKQVEMAKTRCPTATFIPGDMTVLSFEPESFDGIVSFFAIFHLPREEQRGMLSKIFSWLKPGAIFAFNFATVDDAEIHGEFLGRGMFWSSYSVEDSKAMVKEVGFDVDMAEVLEAGDGKLDEDDPDYGVKFLWIAARKVCSSIRECRILLRRVMQCMLTSFQPAVPGV